MYRLYPVFSIPPDPPNSRRHFLLKRYSDAQVALVLSLFVTCSFSVAVLLLAVVCLSVCPVKLSLTLDSVIWLLHQIWVCRNQEELYDSTVGTVSACCIPAAGFIVRANVSQTEKDNVIRTDYIDKPAIWSFFDRAPQAGQSIERFQKSRKFSLIQREKTSVTDQE